MSHTLIVEQMELLPACASSAHNPVTSRGYDRPRGPSSGLRPAPAATSAFRIPMRSHPTLDSANLTSAYVLRISVPRNSVRFVLRVRGLHIGICQGIKQKAVTILEQL